MFNEPDMAALQKALDRINEARKIRFADQVRPDELAAALDAAGIGGLNHDSDPLHCPGCDGDHL